MHEIFQPDSTISFLTLNKKILTMKKTLLIALMVCPFLLPLASRAQQNVQLLGHLAYPENLAALWGYTDASGHEWALVGSYSGLSIVDLGDPSHPTQVQFVSTKK